MKENKLAFPLPNKCKFLLVGQGYNLCSFAEQIIELGLPKPTIYTLPSSEHERDRRQNKGNNTYLDVIEFAKGKNLKIIQQKKLTLDKILEFNETRDTNILFSLSSRWIFDTNIINHYAGMIFNIHPSFLPEEQGGGVFTWRILKKKKFVAGTIHQIDEGIDTGDIIIQKKKKISVKNINPLILIKETNNLFDNLQKQFIEKIMNEELVVLKSQKKKKSYLPRLHSETNGAIDWKWNVNEIETFIRAFSNPYPGAFTFIREKKICIIKCKVVTSKKENHPYLIG